MLLRDILIEDINAKHAKKNLLNPFYFLLAFCHS